MSPSEAAEVEAPKPGERGILCVRCEHINDQGQTRCAQCGARLFVECSSCGELNQRVFTRCRKCHKRLHGGLFHHRHRRAHQRLSWRSLKQRLSMTFFQVVLVLLALGLAFLVFYLLNGARLPGLL
jgi:hypothetical protein